MNDNEKKPYNKDGYYVQIPIVLMVLLTPVELMVLCIIIHLTNIETKPISLSLFMALTGRDKKSVRRALENLALLKIIKKGKKCRIGTQYRVDDERLGKMVGRLNEYRNAVTRLKYADAIRGKHNINTIHQFVIKALSDTSTDSNNSNNTIYEQLN